jgi:hypothetical protein
MRLWSLHPKYLDAKGLVALWREALLAQAVLGGKTRGYLHHPQLTRFRASASPLAAISRYLAAVHAEATRRGYAFDASRIVRAPAPPVLAVTSGQLAYEWSHLLAKLATRDARLYEEWRHLAEPECHPLFVPRAGPIESWERIADA